MLGYIKTALFYGIIKYKKDCNFNLCIIQSWLLINENFFNVQ